MLNLPPSAKLPQPPYPSKTTMQSSLISYPPYPFSPSKRTHSSVPFPFSYPFPPCMRSSPFLTNAHKQLKIRAVSDFERQAHVTPREVKNLSVVYHGLPGSFSESVVLGTFPNATGVPCNELETALSLVVNQTADYAVMPLDPRYPKFKKNYDLLLTNQHQLCIVNEVRLPLHLCLLAMPSVQLEELKCVTSHSLVLDLSEENLAKFGLATVAADDTAKAAAELASGKLSFDTGVIASFRAAEITGLDVLVDGVQDQPVNDLRFVVLGKDPLKPQMIQTVGQVKTSLVFFFDDFPLFLLPKIVSIFWYWEIKITSAVIDKVGQAYLCYVDVDASMVDNRAKMALEQLRKDVPEYVSMKTFGTYEKHTPFWSGIKLNIK